MRLTLRTLLSYLDNVLDEPDRSALREQIESNPAAAEWVLRTRDVMRRLRLAPPDLTFDGGPNDPNTVAEYLDRTLSDEEVPDFERQCLESDAMLAEVASCHAVLAMVLEKPAAVDPDTRARMVRLHEELDRALQMRIEQPHAPPPPESTAGDAELDSAVALSEEAPPIAPPLPEVEAPPVAAPPSEAPDYLREPDSAGWVRWAPAVAAALLFIATAVLLLRPSDPGDSQAANDRSDTIGELLDAEPTPADASEGPGDAVEDETGDDAAGDDAAIDTDSDTGAIDRGPEADTAPAQPDSAARDVSTPSDSADDALVAGAPTADAPSAEPSPETPSETPAESLTDPSTNDAPAYVAPVVRYEGAGSEIALVRDGPDDWRRLGEGATLTGESALASLPAFRSAVRVGEGLVIDLVGSTKLTLSPPTEAQRVPSVVLDYGRIVLSAVNGFEEPVEVELRLNGVGYLGSLASGAMLAIEADRSFEPGAPLLVDSRSPVVVAHSLGGAVEWRAPGETLRYERARTWVIASPYGLGVPEEYESADWANSRPAIGSEADAARYLAESIAFDQPVWPQLAEIAKTDDFREVRVLAMEGCLALGHPEPLVKAFREDAQEADWPAYLAALRQHASRRAEYATLIQQGFADVYGEDAAEDLMDLLSGYSAEDVGFTDQQVADGVAGEVLLELLASDELALRAVAWLVMDELFEPMERPFSPVDMSKRRARNLRALKAQLESGKLVPRRR